ncbi:MAG TPA: YihY/virulence factor BrkB family protein, partial [Kribbella sp.]|nr:YihY/virulence factor BrkB family protein [Kribbella sp.]
VIGANAAYGALALPLALLVWIYLMTRVIMLIAAWTKEAGLDARAAENPEPEQETAEPETVGRQAVGRETVEPAAEPLVLGPPGKRYKVIPVPQRKADTVAVAAGAVLGATVTTLAVQAARAVRSVRHR